jgi:hypothetical protein
MFALYCRILLPQSAARERRGEIVAGSRDMAPLLRQAWASFSSPEADLRDDAARLEAPIWIAWAKSDRVIPLAMVRPAINRLKNARLTVFQGGHTPFVEHPMLSRTPSGGSSPNGERPAVDLRRIETSSRRSLEASDLVLAPTGWRIRAQ